VLDGNPVFTGTPTFDNGQTIAVVNPSTNLAITGTLSVTGATTLASASQSGAATFATGTGAVSLNGATTVASGKTFAVTSNATVGGTLTTTGVSVSAGVTDGSSAAAGTLGEFVGSKVAVGSAVSLTSATPANVTSISLTAGDWDVRGLVDFAGASATVVASSLWVFGINTTSATIPVDGTEAQLGVPALSTTSFMVGSGCVYVRLNITTTTTVYLVAEATFTAGAVAAYGSMTARRVR
jgi:hypothetical protein